MNHFSLSWRIAWLTGLLGCAAATHAQERAPVPGFGRPVPIERLAAIRGGFDLGEGLLASFGIERAVYVDGHLLTYINITVPDIAHISAQQAMSLASALGTVNVQNGAGNTFDPSSMGQTSAATVIQNTLNNQAIRSTTTLNIAVNTLNAFRDDGLQQSLQSAQVQGLRH